MYAHLVSPELPNLGWLCTTTTQKSHQVRQTQPQPGRCTSLWRASDGCQRPLVPRIVGAILPLRYTDNARILLVNPHMPKYVCPTCLLGRQKS